MKEANGSVEAVVVSGMTCANCAAGIERKLKELGCQDVQVNFASSVASFRLPETLGRHQVEEAVHNLGFRVVASEEEAHRTHLRSLTKKFLVALIFTLPLVAMHVGFHWPLLHEPVMQFALATPVVLIALYQFGMSAVRSIRNGVANMDALIILGVLASYGYSLYGFLAGLGMESLYFESAATITCLVLLGNILETRSVSAAASAIAALQKLSPATAKKVVGETIEEIPAAAVQVDDVLLANTGDQVPTDGEVIWGEAAINESIVTGESRPIDREIGATVIGGTLVEQGSIKLRARAVGHYTVLANIIRLVNEAQTNKPSIQRIGDFVSSIFVPTVLCLAALTFLGNWLLLSLSVGEALLRAVAVLVIACPCAMGLATPTAVMVGIGRGARRGILFRGGRTLEEFASVKKVIFDKTGTLTDGQFRLEDVSIAPGENKEELLARIHGLERHSSHPIAKSLVLALKDTPPAEMDEVSEQRARGIRGTDTHGVSYSLGSAKIIPANSPVSLKGDLFLLRGETVVAALTIGDLVRPEAVEAVANLRALGSEVALLSGDRAAVCERVSKAVGIPEYYGDHTPEQKLQRIKEFEKIAPVAFVGDGVNDAPSLAGATIGISIGKATEAAVQSADVVVLGGDVKQVPYALALAKATLRTIKTNLFWAFSYNIVAIPLAAFGYLSPTLAAFAMGFSDVMLIANSIVLRFRKI